MTVAFRDFRDEEYFIPKEIFEKAGADITTVSTSPGIAIGVDGGEAKIDMLISDFSSINFDAVVFIGGSGTQKLLDDSVIHRIAQESIRRDKVVGAICVAPVILAKAKILQRKKATVWSSALDKSAVKILKDNGAIYIDESVVVDGKIVTGNGPGAAEEFAEKIIGLLAKK